MSAKKSRKGRGYSNENIRHLQFDQRWRIKPPLFSTVLRCPVPFPGLPLSPLSVALPLLIFYSANALPFRTDQPSHPMAVKMSKKFIGAVKDDWVMFR
jgi:hypothetical protein